jgi:hypothetical protein
MLNLTPTSYTTVPAVPMPLLTPLQPVGVLTSALVRKISQPDIYTARHAGPGDRQAKIEQAGATSKQVHQKWKPAPEAGTSWQKASRQPLVRHLSVTSAHLAERIQRPGGRAYGHMPFTARTSVHHAAELGRHPPQYHCSSRAAGPGATQGGPDGHAAARSIELLPAKPHAWLPPLPDAVTSRAVWRRPARSVIVIGWPRQPLRPPPPPSSEPPLRP